MEQKELGETYDSVSEGYVSRKYFITIDAGIGYFHIYMMNEDIAFPLEWRD